MPMWPSCKWTSASADPAKVNRLAEALEIPEFLAKCLTARGLATPEEAEDFLVPKLKHCVLPDKMPGIAQAAEIIGLHILNKGRIVIFGDYDADGITASALLARAITAIGGLATIFIPNRITEGYGLTIPALHRCLLECSPVNLIITVDCGISQTEACREAVARGVEVIITDHHSITEAIPETAAAVVNPELPGTPPPLRHLCGAGVAFKLAHQLARQALNPEDGRCLITSLLPIAAIGTVGDLVPLIGENRLIVSKGLEIMNRADCGGNEGIRALKFKARIYGNVTASDLGFALAPRINAAGRIGLPATAIELLNATSSSEAMKAADVLETNNRDRRSEEADALDHAHELVASVAQRLSSSIVLYHKDWHPGIIGLVASRLVSAYGLPTIILSGGEDGVARGSARCPEYDSLDLMPLLETCAPLLKRYGGHRVAAGISLNPDHIQDFRTSFNNACDVAMNGIDRRRNIIIDAWIEPDAINETLETMLQRLEPCGMMNTVPKLATRALTLHKAPRRFGKTNNHWELTFVETPHRCVAFRRDSMPFKANDRIDVVYTVSSSQYAAVQMILKDAAYSCR